MIKKLKFSHCTEREKDILEMVWAEYHWHKERFEKRYSDVSRRDWDYYHGACSVLESILSNLEDFFADETDS